MGLLRTRAASWLTRRYLVRARKKGFDLSKLGVFPDSALVPLRRDALDPVPELGALRERAPISKLPVPFGMNVWLVTGHAEAKAVLGDVNGFSNDFANLIGKAGASEDDNPGGLGFADPPVHTRLRRLLTPEFTMRRLSRLKPGIQAIVDERLDAMAAVDGPVDLVQEFALPIPSLVICELLGVPYEERDAFQHLSVARFDLFGGAGASLGAISESLSYLLGVVRRQREVPGDGLLGMIIQEHGDQVDDRELAGLADGVLTGGFETTASMLALGALVLLGDEETFKRVRDDDAAVHGFVEELLRYLTVVQVAFPRFAREDVEIAGTRIAKGDVVICSLSGANRDRALGSGMEDFDPSRSPTPHLAFGYGAHRCIGAELARMELRAAYPSLVRRFPAMRLHDRPEDLTFRKVSVVYGVESLPVLLR
ncbi:Cytochrome P450 [Amycolatopsis arida]|uniref:Cytochrome P450 n=1 Tax=Amycolatopsis arida TaxID=587909 RepID=A0A1I5QDF5_9PSEU|nr:cytochrome P450 [Amycolatopsis arida]TDX98800.1 cytochrome P450 [Amycolatopsis arida]SFP44339.1 Cytochrome P450 [Amycolatopsis arida]